jgi:Stage II sporulation protein E (SpoIIE)/GAF domain
MPRRHDLVGPVDLGAQIDRIAKEPKALARLVVRLREMFMSVLGRDLGLRAVLRQVVVAAMDLTGARYGALGVPGEDGGRLVAFVSVGLTGEEEAAALRSPRVGDLLGRRAAGPGPLRAGPASGCPAATGLPPGDPYAHALLAVAISSRADTYANLLVWGRRDGRPFDEDDESVITVLADAAGHAIDDARKFGEVRSEAEEFQRLLLPQLPDLRPVEAAALYQPATAPGLIGGDWYDAIRLPDDTCAVVIGDISGHDQQAAAAMAQTRAMLRALLYQRFSSPGAVLARLDRTLEAITDVPPATICLARLRPGATGWRMRWSTAGHLAPLLLPPGQPGRYLDAEPGLPLGVDSSAARPEHHHRLPAGATLVFFTDGLVEHRQHPIDEGLATLARLATQHARRPPERLCRALAGHHPGDGSDDTAILALRLPPDTISSGHPHPR